MIKAIIFDFFDVFRTDSYKAWLHANNIPHEGGYLDANRQMDLGNITTEQFLERLSDLQERKVTSEELDATAQVDEEVVTIAKKLKPKYRIALLSNAPSSFIRNLLVAHDLEQHFHEIVISSEVGMVKPNADIFELTLDKLGVDSSEAVFIDDNEKNVRAAEGVGIKSIQFVSASQLRGELVARGLQLD